MESGELRRKAQERLKSVTQPEDVSKLSEDDIHRLLHELRTHQIELEIQNEELRHAQEELILARDHYADLYDFAPIGYLRLDDKGKIQDANMTACDVLGATRSRITNKSLTDFIWCEDQDVFYLMRRKMEESGQQRLAGELRIRNIDGRAVWISLRCNADTDKSGKITGYRVSISDISERKAAQLELLEYRDNLEQKVAERTQQLEQRSEELEAFSYSIAHDLRAPLRSITGFSQILLADAELRLNSEEINSLQRVIASSKHMARLIDDLLELSRVNRGEFEISTINISQLAWDIVSSLKSAEKNRTVSVKITPALQCRGDERLIRVALENLLGNAWKYTGKNPQALIEMGSIEYKAGKQAFFVRDNGAGFDMKYAHKLFAPFQRLHRQEDFEGTGVGLAITQRIVRRHSGEIWVESRQGEGSTFYFWLP